MAKKKLYLDEDTRLMLKAAKGDRNAYTNLYRKYFSVVSKFISSLNGQVQSAEDITQEVFIRVWENRAKYQPTAVLKTYLFAYAKNVLKENRLLANKEITLDTDELSHLTAKPSQFETISPNEDVIIYLEEVAANLPDRQRQIFELIYITGLSSTKTAELLDCSLDAVHSALYRARKTLRSLSSSFPFGIG